MSGQGKGAGGAGAMLPAAKLWQRTRGRGTSYLAGRLGDVQVLVLPKREGDEGDHSHMLVVAEAQQREGGTR